MSSMRIWKHLTCGFDISMNFFKRFPNFLKYTCLATISCGTGWVYHQFKSTQHILNNALDTSILSIAEPSITKQPETGDFYVIDITKVQETPDFTFQSTWSNLKFQLAKRLLHLANNENAYVRKRAIRQLARLKTLDNWHFSVLSNMIDARTAVALARTPNVDSRLFADSPIPYLNHTQDMIVDVMRDLLINLHAMSQHPCMSYFISKAFVDLNDVERFSDNESSSIELKKFIQNSEDVLPLCLESLVHHASIEKYAKDIADLNGLPLLMELRNRFKENVQVTATICRIISYLSMHRELLVKLHHTGWIKVLAEWINHDDIRISIPAAKALANLDLDEDPVYLQRLYPLHPSTRTIRTPSADIVFVHGLLGGVFYTWRQRKRDQNPLGFLGKKGEPETLTPDVCVKETFPKRKIPYSDPHMQEYIENLEEHLCSDSLCSEYDVVWEDIPVNTNKCAVGPYCCPGKKYRSMFNNDEEGCYTNCWPKDWLAEDCSRLRIIGVNYETNLSMWTPICPIEKVKTLDERSEELMQQLIKVGLGQRPVIWVTHSMGGIMVKNLLNKAYESNIKEVRNMCLNTKGIVFYSTPHTGSSVAKFSQATALVIWPSTEVQELQENSPKLIEIHQKFLKLTKDIPMKVVTFIETQPTLVSAMKFKFLIVQPHSGDPGIGEYYEIPLDHLGICKPASRQSFLYQKVLHMVQDILDNECTTN